MLKKKNNRSIVIYEREEVFRSKYVQELKKKLKKNVDADFFSGGTDLSLAVTKERKDISSIIYITQLMNLTI
ncbi:MAG: hypothetical protein Ct9H300mP5_1530 [Candidatus Pelagibacterales bacterium]|nr:MAG: hypothetical protein Ct9H300mP5_1530 [Pelagibacterales bacterium]